MQQQGFTKCNCVIQILDFWHYPRRRYFVIIIIITINNNTKNTTTTLLYSKCSRKVVHVLFSNFLFVYGDILWCSHELECRPHTADKTDLITVKYYDSCQARAALVTREAQFSKTMQAYIIFIKPD